jgi:S1-C subfamily serine protease
VAGLDSPALDLAERSPKGAEAVAIGYPANGPLTFTAGLVTSQDSYGRGPVQRRMTPFRGDVRSGNSGGPVVNLDGAVVTTVFAASISDGPGDGLGVPNGVVAKALGGRLEPTDTGPCAA